MRRRTYYLHTIDREPAVFSAAYQYIGKPSRVIAVSEMATSLRQIRNEQQADIRQRNKERRDIDANYSRRFGYIRVVVDQ